MTLIIILIGMAFEHFVGVADEIRRFAWFNRYINWLENRLARYPLWNGAAGVIISLAGPLLLVALLSWGLSELFLPLGLVFALAVLVYSLGPKYLNPQLDDLIKALEEDNEQHIEGLLNEFSIQGINAEDDQQLIENILVEANERLFGVLFWFIVLGPLGALCYRMTCQLWRQQSDIHGYYSESVRDLYNILNWPTARLMALGNALTGNMVDAVESWRAAEEQSLAVNQAVICASGLGALNFQQQEIEEPEMIIENRIYWLRALQGLLNRSLLAWLTILGIMTISGWLS